MTCDTAWTCVCNRYKCDINDQDHTLYISVRVYRVTLPGHAELTAQPVELS